jgi:hypothetical protein
MSQAPPIVATLIDRFEQNRESYKSQGYNETQLRREFLDPFFEAQLLLAELGVDQLAKIK